MPIKPLHSLINRQSTVDKFLSNDAYAFKQGFFKSALIESDLSLSFVGMAYFDPLVKPVSISQPQKSSGI